MGKGIINTQLIKHFAEEAVSEIKDVSKNIKVPEVVTEKIKTITNTQEPEIDTKGYISIVNAIRIFYYLIASDGSIDDEEIEKLNSIGNALDKEYDRYKESLLKEFSNYLGSLSSEECIYKKFQKKIKRLLEEEIADIEKCIPIKLLLWNLLIIAYSDKTYSEEEKELIYYIADHELLDNAVVLEMESSILTLNDLENELLTLKQTNRPYLTLEPLVKDVEKRQGNIFANIATLIEL